MGKQMEGDNRQRRKNAHRARDAGSSAGAEGATTGGSKQRTETRKKDEPDERLAMTQRGEAKKAGADVPRPLRGKGRQNEPAVPPGPTE